MHIWKNILEGFNIMLSVYPNHTYITWQLKLVVELKELSEKSIEIFTYPYNMLY